MILPVPATSTLNWPFSFSFTRTTIMTQGIQNRDQGRHKVRQERFAQARQHHPSHASGWFVSTTHFLCKYVVDMELFLDRIRNSCFKMVCVSFYMSSIVVYLSGTCSWKKVPSWGPTAPCARPTGSHFLEHSLSCLPLPTWSRRWLSTRIEFLGVHKKPCLAGRHHLFHRK